MIERDGHVKEFPGSKVILLYIILLLIIVLGYYSPGIPSSTISQHTSTLDIVLYTYLGVLFKVIL